jgi:prepilin-type processing-associated H-X9-DG protein
MTMTAFVAPAVTDYTVSADLDTLILRTARDGEFTLPAEQLRLSCKCAHCTRARFDGRFPERFPGIAITEIGSVGYGLNIAFSDGHARGIYPQPYLLSLAGAQAAR